MLTNKHNNDTIIKMKEKFDKIVNSKFGRVADKLCNSVWYIVAYGVVCILAHTLDIPVVGAVLLAVLLVPALLFCKNSFVLMPFLMMCAFVMSENTKPETGHFNIPLNISVLCIVLVVLVAALLFNILYYKKWKQIYKRAYFTISLALMYGALIIGGLGSSFMTVSGFTMSLAIAVSTILPYALMVNCGEYEGRKTVEYFGWALIVAAMVIAVDYLQKFIINDFNLQIWVVKDYLKLGFVGPNTGAAIVTMAIPITFYFVYKYKHGYLFLLLVALELFVIVATYSRASLVVAVPGTVIVSIALCFKKKTGKLGYLIMFALAVVAAIALAVVLRHWIMDKITALFSGNVTGSGRTNLWKSGFNAWCKTPIFGIGLWFLRLNDAHWYYSFHCTPLTYLFCGGLLGLAAYIYHRYKTVRLTFGTKLTAERVFVALTILAMLCNALLDIAMTSATHLLYYAIMLALIECDVKQQKPDVVKPLKLVEWLRKRKRRADAAPSDEDANIESASNSKVSIPESQNTNQGISEQSAGE